MPDGFQGCFMIAGAVLAAGCLQPSLNGLVGAASGFVDGGQSDAGGFVLGLDLQGQRQRGLGVLQIAVSLALGGGGQASLDGFGRLVVGQEGLHEEPEGLQGLGSQAAHFLADGRSRTSTP